MSYEKVYIYSCNLCEVQTGSETHNPPKGWVHVEWTSGSRHDSTMVDEQDFDFCDKCAAIVMHAMTDKGG